MIKHGTACLILILLAVSASMIPSASSVASINLFFVVMDRVTREMVDNATVTIMVSPDWWLYQDTTDETGIVMFTLESLDGAFTYTYTVEKEDYTKATGYYTVAEDEVGNHFQNVLLTPTYASFPFVDPTVKVVGNGTVSTVGEPFTWGSNITLAAQPGAGWRFAYFQRGDLPSTTTNPYTFTNLTSGEVFTAIFKSLAEGDSDEGMPSAVNLLGFPYQLELALGIPLGTGGILATLIMMSLFLFPTLFICAKNSKDVMFPSIFVGVGSLGLCTAIGWLNPWFLIMTVFLVALLLANRMKEIFT